MGRLFCTAGPGILHVHARGRYRAFRSTAYYIRQANEQAENQVGRRVLGRTGTVKIPHSRLLEGINMYAEQPATGGSGLQRYTAGSEQAGRQEGSRHVMLGMSVVLCPSVCLD